MDTNSIPAAYLKRISDLRKELSIPIDYAKRGLAFYLESEDLVIGDTDPNGKYILMDRTTAAQWELMKRAAFSDEIVLLVETAFRTIDEQASLIRQELTRGRSLEEALTWIAAPGYSEHHTGRAIDIGSPDCFPIPANDEFEKTKAFAWLQKNAADFGFVMSYPRGNLHGIIFEPWHWCYLPECLVTMVVTNEP